VQKIQQYSRLSNTEPFAPLFQVFIWFGIPARKLAGKSIAGPIVDMRKPSKVIHASIGMPCWLYITRA